MSFLIDDIVDGNSTFLQKSAIFSKKLLTNCEIAIIIIKALVKGISSVISITPSVQRNKFEREVLFVFAVFETGGKQYKVNKGDVIFVEKLNIADGEKVTFDKVLAVSDDSLTVGAPYVKGATVTAEVIESGRGKKIYVLRYKAKKNEKKKIGHRQAYTKIRVEDITL